MYTLKKVSEACPESYDVFTEGGTEVGHIKIRNGVVRAWGLTDTDLMPVYVHVLDHNYGFYYDETERRQELTEACRAISYMSYSYQLLDNSQLCDSYRILAEEVQSTSEHNHDQSRNI